MNSQPIPYPPRQSFDIQDRDNGKIATTNITNEHAAALRALQPFIQTGQQTDHPWSSASIGLGEFQWQPYIMVSQNQAGWHDDVFTAVLEDG